MSLKIKEIHGSRNFAAGEDLAIEFRWNLWNSPPSAVDHDDAQAAIEAWIADNSLDPFVRYGVSLVPQLPASLDFDARSHLVTASAKWIPEDAIAQKGPYPPDPANISFNVAGESLHITQARSTTASYDIDGTTTTDTKNVIGWDGRQIRGCDILVPSLSFQIQYGLDIDAVDYAFVKTLASLVGKVNSATMFDSQFAIGEVLLIGLQGVRNVAMERWDMSATFLTSPNVTGIVVGDIDGIAKAGFDYLDVTYQIEENTSVDSQPGVIPKPTQVDIRRVYEFADLNDVFG